MKRTARRCRNRARILRFGGGVNTLDSSGTGYLYPNNGVENAGFEGEDMAEKRTGNREPIS